MKILIVYYSRDGHTRKVAEELARALSADIEEIQEPKSRHGIIGWLSAGKDASGQKATAIDDLKSELSGYDLTIVGTPIWAWNIASPVRSFLTRYREQLKKVAFFATMGGSGDKRSFEKMEEICGKTPLACASFIDRKIKKGEFGEELKQFLDVIKKTTD